MTSVRDTIKHAMRLSKNDPRVDYSPTKGRPKHHCGPDEYWPRNYCKFFEGPDSCDKVLGTIDTKGGCLLYQKSEEGE